MTVEGTLSDVQLEERLAALHQASLELIQDISMDTLLKRIARIACEQAGASHAAVSIVGNNDETAHMITVGMDGRQISKFGQAPPGLGLMDVIANASDSIRVNYVQKVPTEADSNAKEPLMTSVLGVPIQLGDKRLGQIYLSGKTNADSFNPDDERLIETLSAYAAAAISNARSYEKLHERDRALTRRNQDLALLNNLASTLASIKELDELLQTALNRVMNYFNLELGEIFLSEEDHNTLHKVLQDGEHSQELWTKDRFTQQESLVGQTARSAKPIIVHLPYVDDPFLNNAALVAAGIQYITCFPLTSRSEVLGVLCTATCNKQPLDAKDQLLLSSIASWVGTTIENIRLNIQGRRLAVLEERERIGMDLHDGVIQSIYAVGLTLEHARLLLSEEPEQSRKRINQSIEDLNSTIRDLRAFIMDMRPRQLYEENLMDGLQRLINEFRANALIEASLSGPNEGLEDLPDTHAIALFHICQEALANIAKHAQAKKVEILIWTTSDRVLMEINDDGKGFDPQEVQLTLGHGISNMQTRVRNVGGDLEISSEPNQGTTIMVWMPYKQEK